ncbi:DUF2975 domain-containing protein [Sphingopyxis sp.]|uniref:DUF2975 domain-containing protein n=1 Tax=Sphingopyxis sp. TaxID=1908224 RepID=UPI003D101103
MLLWSRRLLAGMNILNWAIGLLLLAMLAATFLPVINARLSLGLSHRYPDADIGVVIARMQIALALVAPVTLAAHAIFTRLIAMIDSVAAHNAFVAANASRLRQIAWALLVTQICDLVFGVMGAKLSSETGDYFGWSFGLTGWLAVLLLFILARIFDEGAAMRDELERTI